MKTSNLVDMLGLSGDPSGDEQLDDLLLRLESDTPNALREKSHLLALLHNHVYQRSESGDVLFHN